MTDRDALVAATAAQPHEDTPRLALADWLEENGQPARAGFIRAQCEAARKRRGTPRRRESLNRADDLLAGHEAEWLGEWTSRLADWDYRRGFLSRVRMTADTFLRHADELFRAEPVGRVELVNGANGPLGEDAIRAVVAHPAFAHVRDCAVVSGQFFTPTPVGAWLKAIAENPHVTRLRRFGPTREGSFQHDPHPGGDTDGHMREAVEAFCKAEHLRALEAFELPVTDGPAERRLWVMSAVADAPFAANLRRLNLAGCGVPDEGFRRVSSDPVFANLRHLDLRGNRDWGEGCRAVWHSTTLTNLRSAVLTADQLHAYVASPLARRVRMLTVSASNDDDLDMGGRGRDDWLALIDRAPPPRTFTLTCVNPGDEVFAAMRRNGWLRDVRTVSISGDSQYEVYSQRTAGVRALFGRGTMPRLARLRLHECCDKDVRATLGTWPGTARLEALDLTDDYTGRVRATDLAGFSVSPAARRLHGVWARTDDDITALLGLPGLEAVGDLNLWLVPETTADWNTYFERITPQTLERLFRSPRLSRLERLTLGFFRLPALMAGTLRLFGDPSVLPRLRVFEPRDYMTQVDQNAYDPARRRFGPRMRAT